MRKILYLDTFSGISGDMFLGALVDAGLSLDELRGGLRDLDLEGYEIVTTRVFRGAFEATRLEVLLPGEAHASKPAGGEASRGGAKPVSAPAGTHSHRHSHDPGSAGGSERDRPVPEDDEAVHHHGHRHEHEHHHEHDHHHHDHGHGHGHGHDHGRSLRQILELIDRSRLPAGVKATSRDVFLHLGRAESRAHGVPVEDVTFHEVGAVDSIVDIVGGCLAVHLLEIDEVHASPMTLGSGFARGAHGTFPLPAPATLEVLKGVPVRHRDCGFELTTPTGAALASRLSRSFGPMPPLQVAAIGYGAGNDRPGPIANLLRVVIGETESAVNRDRVVVLETHLDDTPPQWLGHLMERLFDAGALDVTVAPVLMKKSRPGHAVKVLARPGEEEPLEEILFRESTTLGLRRQEMDRIVLPRRWVEVETAHGPARVKIGERDGEILSATPEYDDLVKLAECAGLSLKEAHRLVMDAYRKSAG